MIASRFTRPALAACLMAVPLLAATAQDRVPAPPGAASTAPVDLAAVDRTNVLGRLGVYADPLARKGWLPAPGLDRTFGTLAPGAAKAFPVALVAGYTYRALATCGRECSNLDLSLADPAGRPVAADRRADGIPIVAFRAQVTGPYVLTVRMASCNVEACAYGAALYASPRR